MRDYEGELLLNVWYLDYAYESGKKMADFVLLTRLQHHSKAARLIVLIY